MASDGLTEREKVMLKREGYVRCMLLRSDFRVLPDAVARAEGYAAGEFPLPKVTRRREVANSVGTKYRVARDGGYEFYSLGGGWVKSEFTQEDFAAFAALGDNPDEEIPE